MHEPMIGFCCCLVLEVFWSFVCIPVGHWCFISLHSLESTRHCKQILSHFKRNQSLLLIISIHLNSDKSYLQFTTQMPKYDNFIASNITLLTPREFQLEEEAKTQQIQINTPGLTSADLKELKIQPTSLISHFQLRNDWSHLRRYSVITSHSALAAV